MKLENNIIIPITGLEAVDRARKILKLHNTNYHLTWPNGGKDPRSAHPGYMLSGKLWLDCMGFAAWVKGFSRFQMTFPLYGGYINTDSMIDSLSLQNRSQVRFQRLEKPRLGCFVVYHSRSRKYPKNPKVGHIGVVSQLPLEEPENWFPYISVIHCSAVDKSMGTAIRETSGAIWDSKGMFVDLA